MKKILFVILIGMLVLPSYLWAVNYFACNGSTNITSDNWCTAGAAGLGNCAGTPDTTWATANAAANTLYANGCTLAIPNGTTVSAGKISTKDGDGGGAAVAGGGFTIIVNGVTATVDSSVEGGTTDCLTIGSGANTITANVLTTNGGGTITTDATVGADGIYITGSGATVTIGKSGSPVTVTGGGAANGAINDAHTVTTTTMYANITGGNGTGGHGLIIGGTGAVTITGNIVGGNTNLSTYGIYQNAANAITLTGNVTGGSYDSCFGILVMATGATLSVVGNVTGGSTWRSTDGIRDLRGTTTITGNLINSAVATAASGLIRWTPTAPSNGVTGHYIKFDGGGTAVYCGKNTDDVTKALPSFYYIDPTSGTSNQGTATTGGGAWSF